MARRYLKGMGQEAREVEDAEKQAQAQRLQAEIASACTDCGAFGP
jgi:hypothetical protein